MLRDCDVLNENYEKMGFLKIEEGYYTHPNTGNQQHREYRLTKMQTFDLITGYNTELRIKVNRRWAELEEEKMKREKAIEPKIPQTFAEALRAYADEVEKNEALKLENSQQKQIIGELQPKASYYDLILSSHDCMTVTQIAKDYGLTAQYLNSKLKDLGVQFKQSGQWLLKEKHSKFGYTKSETVPYQKQDGTMGSALHTKWTQKGRLFLYESLKKNGILPLIEQE